MRALALVVVLGACGRLGFDALGDARFAGGSGDAHDSAPIDAAFASMVQSVAVSSSANTVAIDGAVGLAPVVAGDMVLVMCGTSNTGGPCTPTSSPPAIWTALDTGGDLSAYVVCGAPAITSIDLTFVGTGEDVAAIATEWSGLTSSVCLDKKDISVMCGTATWTASMAADTLQNKELLVAIGTARDDSTAWTIDPPYTIPKQLAAPGNTVDVFVADALANPAPPLPTASGTVGAWTAVCWNDLFAFEAIQ